MTASATTAQTPGSRVAHRTRGSRHGPLTRLMSPSDLGRVVKPFVLMDLFDADWFGVARTGLHPHSGMNYLFVRLAGGERWRYSPPEGQTVCWVAIGAGGVVTSEPLRRRPRGLRAIGGCDSVRSSRRHRIRPGFGRPTPLRAQSGHLLRAYEPGRASGC